MDFSSIQDWLRQSPPIDDLGPPSSSHSFVELWAAVARGASALLASRLPTPPEASVLADLSEDLVRRLSEVGEGAVWEHFNGRRTLGELVKAQLEADERGVRRTIYRRVLEALRADGLEALTARRPVVKRHLCATVASWLESSLEILLAVERDHDLLAGTFAFPADARLTGVKTGVSDPHRGGRSVAILTLAAGQADPVSVVFKPRDLRIEAAYHELIGELSGAKPDLASLRSLTVAPCEGYGYVEHVTHRIASSDEEMAGFYRNAGRLTAILYALGCNDCHNENVIADRDQLILIDAETLLQGGPRADVSSGRSAARQSLEARLGDSVMRIGLLPRWFFVAGERRPRDPSALGIEPPAAETETYAGWSELNTDGMAMGPATRRSRLATSLPVGIGGLNRLGDFKGDYRAGFRRQLEAIAANRAAWLNGLERFHGLRSRFVRRPTWVYLQMRGELLQPVALRDEAAQSEALMRLTASKEFRPDVHRDAALAAERTELGRLDVPYFEHPIAGRDLLLGETDVAPDFFAESGLDAARRRIGSLGEDDILAQLALIDGSIAAKARRAHRAQRRDPSKRDLALAAPSAAERLAAAATVRDLLIEASISDAAGHVEWLGIDSATDLERSCYGPLGPTLYSGAAGIALFLAAAGRAGSDERAALCRQLARAACLDFMRLLDPFDRSSERASWWRDQPLGLAGSGGRLLSALLVRDEVPEMRRALDAGLEGLIDALDPEILCADEDLDIIFGCAGLIGPLLRSATPKAIALAETAGDRLVERQDREGGWVVPGAGAKALTGFSHGASGAAAALARLAAATGRDAYGEAALRALRYERAQYDPGEGNWPDYRAGEPRFMLSWCHGAPGVALARLCIKSTPLWDDESAEDLELALAATADATPLGSSLCCGGMGRAAILRAAHARGVDGPWLESATRLEAQTLAQTGSGDGGFGEALGLFQGAAGIGLELLDGLAEARSAVAPHALSAGLID